MKAQPNTVSFVMNPPSHIMLCILEIAPRHAAFFDIKPYFSYLYLYI